MSRRAPDAFIEQFAAVKKRVSALAAQAFAEADVGSLQAKLVHHIGVHSPISQAELARATDSDAPLTGRAIQTLLTRGIVRRARSDEDRREYVLSLTPAGRRLFARVTKLRDRIATRIVDALDDRDLADFERIAAKILAATDDGSASGR
jgi:DNA-binding MarR family transcriptional regulator